MKQNLLWCRCNLWHLHYHYNHLLYHNNNNSNYNYKKKMIILTQKVKMCLQTGGLLHVERTKTNRVQIITTIITYSAYKVTHNALAIKNFCVHVNKKTVLLQSNNIMKILRTICSTRNRYKNSGFQLTTKTILHNIRL